MVHFSGHRTPFVSLLGQRSVVHSFSEVCFFKNTAAHVLWHIRSLLTGLDIYWEANLAIL